MHNCERNLDTGEVSEKHKRILANKRDTAFMKKKQNFKEIKKNCGIVRDKNGGDEEDLWYCQGQRWQILFKKIGRSDR